MKLYILRHEDRTLDASFFSPLTLSGHKNSVKLAKYLKNEKINKIYCSPFIRTLQTINPYINSFKKKMSVNLEYSLAEIQHPDIIPHTYYKINLPKYIAEEFNHNERYMSLLSPEKFDYPEDYLKVKKRVKTFLKKIFNENIETNNNIIFVTHQIVCKIILETLEKDFAHKINNTFYPTGSLTKVFDTDKWIYQQINW
uniref:Histidine phosphatase superfamily PROTEIN n=1 Tax=Megaviridae environmental sample TaxID=1737588 RepID=A0A5J6VJK5_9VIRU|nr:MAG: histidine phosphatase superfamily PROTEIN [Megaviridae environmental sample]